MGDREIFASALANERAAVRVAAIHGLVSVDATETIAGARHDSSREVRVAVAAGLGAGGSPDGVVALGELATDLDALVRAAALDAAALLDCVAPLDNLAAAAVSDHAWQVRKGAARALGAAKWTVAEKPFLLALSDTHADVRKAAVQSLSRWAAQVSPESKAALEDQDADVRAYARHALQ